MTTKQDDEVPPAFPAPTEIFADYLRQSISVANLVKLAWTGRLLIVTATITGLFYGIYAVHRNGPSYIATMRISPAQTDNSLGAVGGAGGVLAGLTGAGAGTTALPKFTQFMLSKASVGVAKDLDQKYDMLCRIFAGECDPSSHKWKERKGLRASVNAMLATLAGLPNPNQGRTVDDLAEYIAGAVTMLDNKNNSMVEAHYTNRKPEFAKMFLSAVIKSTNDYIRAQSREQQKRYVEYLSNSAAKTTNVEQRMAIDALLLQEERQLMMTEVDVPYAAQVLDGPTVKPVNDGLKIIIIDGLIGMALGAAAAVCRNLLPRKWRFW